MSQRARRCDSARCVWLYSRCAGAPWRAGIGFALSTAAVEHGINVMMADIQATAMESSALELKELADANGVEVDGHVTDTSSDESVASLAAAVAERFPGLPISLVAANAGIGDSQSVYQAPDSHWQRMLGINVFGVVNTLRHFVPTMVAQEEPGVIVSTASLMGITTGSGSYGVAKHAVVATMESLYTDLRGRGENAKNLTTHVLCPQIVATNVTAGGPGDDREATRTSDDTSAVHRGFQKYGSKASKMAELVFEAATTGQFYLLCARSRPMAGWLAVLNLSCLWGYSIDLTDRRTPLVDWSTVYYMLVCVPLTRADMDTDIGFVRAAAEMRYQAILASLLTLLYS